MRTLGKLFLGAALLLPIGSQAGNYNPGTGDGDPFPLQCVDFSGTWRADNGTKYTIAQQDCKYLRINMHWSNYEEETVSIVPDNRSRGIPGRERSAVRHRWNSSSQGTVIQSHRTFVKDGFRYTEVVMYELEATAGILLETTYSTVECLSKPGLIERDYEQQVFRKLSGGSNGVKPPKGHDKKSKR